MIYLAPVFRCWQTIINYPWHSGKWDGKIHDGRQLPWKELPISLLEEKESVRGRLFPSSSFKSITSAMNVLHGSPLLLNARTHLSVHDQLFGM